MKQKIIGASVLVLFIAAGLLLGSGRHGQPQSKMTTDDIPSLSIKVVSETQKDGFFDIQAEYPQFADPRLDPVNTAIADYVNGALAQFKKDSEENWRAREATLPTGTPKESNPAQPFFFGVTWQPDQLNAHYVSLVVKLNWYSGGAHGNDDLKTFNYDLEKGKVVALTDFFPNDPNYLKTVSVYARNALQSSLSTASGGHVETGMLDAGTAPDPKNFANFTFDAQTVTFYFQKYQVAPGYFGPQTVQMRANVK